MGEKSESSTGGKYLNGTYLLLGSIASVVAIVTGVIAMRETKSTPATDTNKPPAVQVQLPAPPTAGPTPALPPPPPLPSSLPKPPGAEGKP